MGSGRPTAAWTCIPAQPHCLCCHQSVVVQWQNEYLRCNHSVVLFFPLVWNQAAESPPCSAGFGPGCRERGCPAGPACAEQTEQHPIQGGSNWRFGWWSHWEHHWIATSARWVVSVCCCPSAQLIPNREVLNPLPAFALPVDWLLSLQTAFSHFCQGALSASEC